MATQPKLPLTNLVTVHLRFLKGNHTNIVALEMAAPLDTKDLKKLWDVEQLLNSLPSDTRLHVDVQEQKPTFAFKLVEGHRYRVRYRLTGVHRKDHEFVGTYLSDESGRTELVAQFSLRPASGTSTLAYRCILEVTEVPVTVPHSNPRRIP